MANTYSSNLRLIIQTNGENAGTWGTYTNTNIATLLEQAITGVGAIAVSGSSNYTLTTANGASDESRNAILNVTGTLTAAINIVCPTVSKTYIIKNGTTGGYAITLKTSAGTGISVPNGGTMYLYCDGTNVVNAITINAITGGSIDNTPIGATTPSTGAFTTLSASSTVSGTGFSTYLASPPAIGSTTASTGAFTTLSASSTVTLSGGTANGVGYLNASKVFTTGSALTFDGTNFSVIGGSITTSKAVAAGTDYSLSITDTTAGKTLSMLRSGSGYSYAGIGSQEGALYTYGNNLNLVSDGGVIKFNLGTAGAATEQMRLTSTGLGIGTSSPSQKLHVAGTNAIALIDRTAAASSNPELQLAAVARQFNVGVGGATFATTAIQGAYYIYDATASVYRMMIDVSGNVGIGVTPSAWDSTLKAVIQTGSAGAFLTGQGSSEGIYLGSNSYYNSGWKYVVNGYATYVRQQSGSFAWYTAPSGTAGNAITFTQAMTLDASGNLGVGTSSPGQKFEIAGGTYQMRLGQGGSVGIYDVGRSPTTGIFQFYGYQTGAIAYTFGGVDGERARIDSSGNLLVGTTSTGLSNSNSMTLQPNSSGSAYVNHVNGSASGNGYWFFGYNGSSIGSITQNGTTGVLYNITSDYRLKDVVGVVTNSGSRIDALEPIDYTMKTDGSTHKGFLAHKFQEVYPNSVTGEKDAVDKDGNPVYQCMQAGTAEVIADLVSEIQSLRKRIATLEAK